MKGFRSPILGALVALACTPSMEVARREDYIHHLFLRSVSVYAAARFGVRRQSAQPAMASMDDGRTIVIFDDLVTQPPTPEQRAKMEAWFDEALARRGKGRPVVGIDRGREVLSTIRDDAGRALAHVALPAGRPLTMDDIQTARPAVYQPKLEPHRAPSEPPRYSAKPKPKARVPIAARPEARAEKRIRKAGRTATKKRRGWS